jgi:hypothetical protein
MSRISRRLWPVGPQQFMIGRRGPGDPGHAENIHGAVAVLHDGPHYRLPRPGSAMARCVLLLGRHYRSYRINGSQPHQFVLSTLTVPYLVRESDRMRMWHRK